MQLNRVVIILLAFGTVVVAGLVVGEAVCLVDQSRNKNYAPEQPIPFSHKIHAGDNKMECLYCHFNADKSRHAGIPPMSLCMGCHKTVAVESEHIKKMKALNDKGESFAWVKVYNLPEHVSFPHRRHINAGVRCQTCHGEVQEMDKVKQARDLTMGWCLSCHRGNDYVSKDLGVGYRSYATHHEATLRIGESGHYGNVVKQTPLPPIDKSTHMNASTECSACHR